MPFITGVAFNAESGELVITSQDFKVDGGAIVPDGDAVESKTKLTVPGIVFNPGMRLGKGGAALATVSVTNKGLVPVFDYVLTLTQQHGKGSLGLDFHYNELRTVADVEAGVEQERVVLLPGETHYWVLPLEQPSGLLGGTLKNFLATQPIDDLRIALKIRSNTDGPPNTEIASVSAKRMKEFIGVFSK